MALLIANFRVSKKIFYDPQNTCINAEMAGELVINEFIDVAERQVANEL